MSDDDATTDAPPDEGAVAFGDLGLPTGERGRRHGG
jgi:hypothetical protein